ncbi:YeeE/YedE family protein [Sinimarinibacterium sp. NLF-5-8]|uniref:YeeE/YedE family protein n=1 Tax=Sinimarinibacterium sp. NLF-5-8 TaxID=2698684 RepID=UPI00137BE1D6|nr:YeeE/YedE family protein [Sinimarinibacterium sp. NLF-5-8]QHS11229.1 YeeE/YedE family protein [Sinimarinibacterium sp. NLF-5-8]
MTLDWQAFTPWASLIGGLMIGAASALFLLANGRIAGISGLLGAALQRGAEGRAEKFIFLLGLVAAPVLWMLFKGEPEIRFQSNALGLIVAGLLVGVGTRYGSGCTSGHGVCGISRFSPRSMIAVATFMTAGFVTVFVLRHWLEG